ncbi:bpX6 domain-containing protein [Kitasatospora purpeofusca]|uniref:bpX6 domain-containing protein n=1 Tax=Kitasatospora purpeofusca TaxID=67352 RepID=UPI002A5A8EC0|nr:bpX6 domain-containing protein [Kitasatospora purpeofusca]MDY0812614.1 bpX6 domain-containing protein [Kitasatospora purpeofusca]
MNAPIGSPTGTVPAVGFVLDVPLIGVPEAAGRVLDLWRADARLCELTDGRWLLLLPEPVRTRADLAPGLPLERTGHGAPTGASGPGPRSATVTADGRLVLTEGGATITRVVGELPGLDPADWLDPTGLALHRPRPVGAAPAPEAPPVEESVPVVPRPDLRAAAGIGPSSERARRLTAETRSARSRRARRQADRQAGGRTGSGAAWWQTTRPIALAPRHTAVVVGLLMVVPLLFVVLFGLGLLKDLSVDPGGIVYASIGAGLVYGALFGRRAAQDGGETTAPTAPAAGGTPAPRRGRRPWLGDLLARFTLRTPAAHLLHQRHARYLRELTRAFEQHRWDDALRDALPLAGRERGDTAAGRSWFSVALPKRFTGQLRPTPHRVGPAATNAFSSRTVHQHLTELYRSAAERLERQDRFDEAAFVLADLLEAPAEAVALLDRHGRLTQAAELAEGRDLAAELVVRLWWRAGERARAVRTAHRRGAFATAVERLAATDPQAARELRAAWAEHCRAAGDRLGAVEAAWPDQALRPSVAADLRDAVALGGPTRGRALPYLLALPDLTALGSGAATRALARAVLDSDGHPGTTGRSVLAATLAGLPAADPATDRELATAAARAAVRDGGLGGESGGPGGTAEHSLFDRLLRRADPLTAADLPRPRPLPRPVGVAPAYTAAERPGTLPVLDAVLLASGSLLVACGQAGARLLAPDGRTRAHWDTPTDRLVLADHGGGALLVTDHGPDLLGLAHLDLATRTVRPWITLRARRLAPSYDGHRLIAAADGGIVVLDTSAPRPVAVWRELGGGERLLGGITRTAGGCAVLVRSLSAARSPLVRGLSAARSSLTEVWRWDLPGWELRARLRVDDALTDLRFGTGSLARTSPAATPDPVALAAGGLLTVEPLAAGPLDADDGTASGDRTVLRWTSGLPTAELTVDGRAVLGPAVDGDHWALTVPTPDGTGLRAYAGTGPCSAPELTVQVPNASGYRIGVRRHAGAVTYWHRSGRVLATSADGTALLANLRVTVR